MRPFLSPDPKDSIIIGHGFSRLRGNTQVRQFYRSAAPRLPVHKNPDGKGTSLRKHAPFRPQDPLGDLQRRFRIIRIRLRVIPVYKPRAASVSFNCSGDDPRRSRNHTLIIPGRPLLHLPEHADRYVLKERVLSASQEERTIPSGIQSDGISHAASGRDQVRDAFSRQINQLRSVFLEDTISDPAGAFTVQCQAELEQIPLRRPASVFCMQHFFCHTQRRRRRCFIDKQQFLLPFKKARTFSCLLRAGTDPDDSQREQTCAECKNQAGFPSSFGFLSPSCQNPADDHRAA